MDAKKEISEIKSNLEKIGVTFGTLNEADYSKIREIIISSIAPVIAENIVLKTKLKILKRKRICRLWMDF